MGYNPKDRFFKKAKKEGFVARSVYKLEEIDQKFKIFRPGQMVFDLGASPGSWSQYASQRIGEDGRILGVDLSPMTVSLPNAVFLQSDLRELSLGSILQDHGFSMFDIVMSDMMSNTTGIKSVDQIRSHALCELALSVADQFLKPGGTFICKFFQSGGFENLRKDIKRKYERAEAVKPESTRSISKEIFIVGLKKKRVVS
jgi:23S rRNA (uridine2552-2'-O)-methyltransferase